MQGVNTTTTSKASKKGDLQWHLSSYLSNTRGFVLLLIFLVSCIALGSLISTDTISAILKQPVWASLWDLKWAFIYVLSLYVWKYDTKMTPALRDELYVVWQRLTSIVVVCFCFVYLTPLSWPAIGLPSSIVTHVLAAAVGLILPAIMYAGMIVYAILAPEEELVSWPSWDWLFFRNTIAAPIAEEVAFRMCMVPIMLHAGFSSTASVFITPLWFGLAHVHHVLNDDGRTVTLKLLGKSIPVRIIYLQVIAQAVYTTLFGFFASYLFLRTGSIFAPTTAHIFCNFFGLPPTDFMGHPKGKQIGVVYIAGALCFFAALSPLTSASIFTPLNAS